MTKRRGLISLLITISLFTGMSLAAPTAYGETFCGGWDFGSSGQAGGSHIWKISNATSNGDAYSGAEALCSTNDDDANGTFSWKVQHGKVNTGDNNGRVGNEHGTFTFVGEDGSKLGGIFNGAIAVYELTQCDKTNDDDEQKNLVYSSSGRFNTLKNNEARTGSDSTFHGVGTYLVRVTASDPDAADKGKVTCHFEARLAGQQN